MKVETNSNGNNKNIKCHLLPDAEMKVLKFTERREGWLTFSKTIDKQNEIVFFVSINKSNPLDYRIDVIDDDFGQPYDYQHILSINPNHSLALSVKEKVEVEMGRLANAGLISGHEYGEYI